MTDLEVMPDETDATQTVRDQLAGIIAYLDSRERRNVGVISQQYIAARLRPLLEQLDADVIAEQYDAACREIANLTTERDQLRRTVSDLRRGLIGIRDDARLTLELADRRG